MRKGKSMSKFIFKARKPLESVLSAINSSSVQL